MYSFETLPVGDDPPVWLHEDGRETELAEPLSRFLLPFAGYCRRFGWGRGRTRPETS